MKPFILVADGFDAKQFSLLQNISEFDVHSSPKISQEELRAILPKVNGLIIRSTTQVTAGLLESAPNLKLVIRAGEGTDNIDKIACEKKGVKVANTPGANGNSAAEHAIALMFTLLRNTSQADASMKTGKWEKSRFPGMEMWNKTIGIIGFGKIGQTVAKRLSGFEPNILFFDPVLDSSPLGKKVDLDELLKESDIVTIHAPLIEQTKNLINYDNLSKMKESALLINAARGGIVNEDDLHMILTEKKISGAALDVFLEEPLRSRDLTQHGNIILTPHLGASTKEAQERVGEMCVNQLKEFFINNKLINQVKA